jgi:diadenosine tetraphosphate (Ap4A) HIT family hydrolase
VIESAFEICSDAYYVIEQCMDCPIPGYLIVTPVSQASRFEGLTKEEKTALGNILASAVAVVKRVVQPIRVYCAQFGENDGPLHFHIFPRTEEITEEYLKENLLEHAMIDGPILLGWSRRKYTDCEDPSHLDNVVHQIREALKRERDNHRLEAPGIQRALLSGKR